MKAKFTTLFAAAGLLALSSTALAIPFTYNTRPVTVTETATQASLQQVVDGVVGANGINVATDQSRIGAWTTAELDVDAYRIALLSPLGGGALGIFSLGTGAEYTLLNATNLSGGYTSGFSIEQNETGTYSLFINKNEVDANFGQSFGFYWADGGKKSYTMDTKNVNGSAQALSYLVGDGTDVTLHRTSSLTTNSTAIGNNDWILAFENQSRTLVSAGIYDSLTDFNDAVFFMEDMNPVPEPATLVLLGAGFLGLAVYSKRRKNS